MSTSGPANLSSHRHLHSTPERPRASQGRGMAGPVAAAASLLHRQRAAPSGWGGRRGQGCWWSELRPRILGWLGLSLPTSPSPMPTPVEAQALEPAEEQEGKRQSPELLRRRCRHIWTEAGTRCGCPHSPLSHPRPHVRECQDPSATQNQGTRRCTCDLPGSWAAKNKPHLTP